MRRLSGAVAKKRISIRPFFTETGDNGPTMTALLGAGLQSTSWLYTLWHAGFATFVIAYALLKNDDPSKRLWRGCAAAAILLSVALTAAVVCAAAYIVTAGDALMPRIIARHL
jgi:hypothetical protein